MRRGRRTGLGVVLVALGCIAAPGIAAAAPDSVVSFDGPPAVVGQSTATTYAADPGLVFGPSPRPALGSIPSLNGCGIYVSATSGATSAPNAGALACGGGEFPSPPTLYGTFTTTTRTRVSLEVGDTSATGHMMKLTAYDGDGLVVGTAGPTLATASGALLSVTGGQPEIASFLLEETGNHTVGGVWVDDITADNPPVPGHPAFSLQRTGSGSTYLTQGAPTSTVDLSLYRVNGSDGNVAYSVSGLPTGVDATQVPSVNGVGIALTASPEAPITVGDQSVPVTVTASPQDAGAGTRNQVVTFFVRVAPALVLSARGVTSTPVPSCNTLLLDYGIVDYAGPASWAVSGLPSGVTATINGTAAGSAPAVTGSGTVRLGFTTTAAVSGNPVVHVGLVGSSFYTSIFPAHLGRYGQSRDIALTQAVGLTVSPTSGRTPQRLGPGTSVTVSGGDHLCAGPTARVRFGNDQALAPIVSASRDGTSVTAVVPRNATTGPVSLVPDAATPGVRIDGSVFTVDSYRNTTGYSFHNYVPKLTMGQATTAFGYRATHLTIDPCPVFDCPITTPIPDPWTMILLAVANGTMGKSDGGGACFGFSRTSQQLRRGDHALSDFSPAGAANAFALDGPDGPSGPVQEYINSGQLSLLSNEYIPFYLTHATANTVAGTPGTIRGEVTSFLQRGDDPQISVRDGGSLTKMHVVVAYDIEQDPSSSNPGDYYIDVYDSNQQFIQAGRPGDETTADGASHAMRLAASRIHVRNDGFWELPSSRFSASSLGNIVVSGYENPPRQPSELTLGGLGRQGLVLLLGSDVARFLPRQRGPATAAATVPSATDQISAGGRTLYSKPGVLNTDPKKALQATPWVPPTGGTSDVEGYILGAGAGADYKVALTSAETTTETRTVLGGGFMGQITTTLGKGVKNQLTVQPGQRSIGFSTKGGAVPLTTQLVGRAADGSTRTVTTKSTVSSGGGDTLSLGSAGSTFSLVHRGASANVAVTLSWVGKSGPPQAVTARLRMAANATLRLAPSNWARLADRAIRVANGARHGRLKIKAVHSSGVRLSRLKLARSHKRLTAKIVARAPRRLANGTAIVSWQLSRSGKVLARHAVPLAHGGRARLAWALPAKARKGDRLDVVVVTVLRHGGVFSSTTSRVERRI